MRCSIATTINFSLCFFYAIPDESELLAVEEEAADLNAAADVDDEGSSGDVTLLPFPASSNDDVTSGWIDVTGGKVT